MTTVLPSSAWSDADSESPLIYDEKLDKEAAIFSPALTHDTTSNFVRLLYILCNVVSAVLIIFVNKHAMSSTTLSKLPISIVAFHSSCTSALLYVISRPGIRYFKPKWVSLRLIMPLAAAFGLYVALGLQSISYNPVAIYQLGKILNGPVVAGLNYVLYQERLSLATILSVGAICSGVGLTVKGGWAATNSYGLALVIASTLAAGIYQIWVGRKHKELGLNSSQLLLNQAPVSAILLLPVIIFFDDISAFGQLDKHACFTIALTGVLAALVNLSQFLVIQTTSALTFNVVSQLKTCLVLVLAYISDGRQPSMFDYAGLVITTLGTCWYSALSMRQAARAKSL